MIARDLGISDPAIHYHFPTKQSLYEALLVAPDYGPTATATGPVTRETVMGEALRMFDWWTARPEFGQMLLREQLASDAASLTFMSSSDTAWNDAVTRPLISLLGDQGSETSALVFEMLAGVFWDAILSYGDRAGETMQQASFRRRLREMVSLAIAGSDEDDA